MNIFKKKSRSKTPKDLLSNREIARVFFRQHLTKEVKEITDLGVLQLCRCSFVDKALKPYLSDVLYSTRVCGREGFLYVLIENRDYLDSLTPFRLHEYMIAAMKYAISIQIERKEEPFLPLIFPMLYHEGQFSPKERPDFFTLFPQPNLARACFLAPFQLIKAKNSKLEAVA